MDPEVSIRPFRLTTAAALLLAVTGCSRHPAAVGTAPASTTPPVAATSQALAARLNTGGYTCTGYTPNPDLQLGREGGYCTHGGKRIAVTTYATAAQQDTAKKIIDGSGLASGWSVVGDRWLVSGIPDRPGADTAARILGGAVDNP
jgi:hypothetical protein